MQEKERKYVCVNSFIIRSHTGADIVALTRNVEIYVITEKNVF